MARFYMNNKVRVLRKRASPSQPDEIGIIVEIIPAERLLESGKNLGPGAEMYKVMTLENCPPGCPKEEDYCEEELELVSWGLSMDIYQFA